MDEKMKEYYECHITMDSELHSKNYIQNCVENLLGWKYSAINGDPDLGPGMKCYATKQFNAKHPPEDIVKWLDKAAAILYDSDIKILRRKVEMVIHDNRSPMETE